MVVSAEVAVAAPTRDSGPSGRNVIAGKSWVDLHTFLTLPLRATRRRMFDEEWPVLFRLSAVPLIARRAERGWTSSGARPLRADHSRDIAGDSTTSPQCRPRCGHRLLDTPHGATPRSSPAGPEHPRPCPRRSHARTAAAESSCWHERRGFLRPVVRELRHTQLPLGPPRVGTDWRNGNHGPPGMILGVASAPSTLASRTRGKTGR